MADYYVAAAIDRAATELKRIADSLEKIAKQNEPTDPRMGPN